MRRRRGPVPRVTKTRLAPDVFLVRFRSQYELAATFLRFQEYAESSRFSGRTFSLEEFMDWYASTHGNFTYFEDWSGFNIPSTAFEPFYDGSFDPLLDKERRFLEMFEDEHRPFYVIGVAESSSPDDLTHEIAHALFFTTPRYRAGVLAAMRGHDTSAIERALQAEGYSRRVVKDEVHAYLIAGDGAFGVSAMRRLAPLRKTLRSIFERHSAGLLEAARKALARRR